MNARLSKPAYAEHVDADTRRLNNRTLKLRDLNPTLTLQTVEELRTMQFAQ